MINKEIKYKGLWTPQYTAECLQNLNIQQKENMLKSWAHDIIELNQENINNVDDSKSCKVCSDETKTVFNINFKATPICESCAISIFLQQANWYTQQEFKNKEK